MSHSYRHTPIVGMSTARSEALDKRCASRRGRRAVKQTLSVAEEGVVQEPEHRRSGVGNFAKDGKQWVKNAGSKLFRK